MFILIMLSNCVGSSASLLGPAITAVKTGNVYHAGLSYTSNNIIKKKLFNEFYLFKSPKNLSKLVAYKDFNCFKDLSQKYKSKKKIDIKAGKDLITLYKK